MRCPLLPYPRWWPPAACVCTAALLLTLAACDNTIDPFSEEEGVIFAIHGVLSMTADTQFVRVQSLRAAILGEDDAQLQAAVTTTNLSTGETVAWTDSLVTLDDGSTGHLFYALFDVALATTYHLDIRRSDGRTTRATTTVPSAPSLVVFPPSADTQTVAQKITLRNVNTPPNNTSVRYRVGRTANDPEDVTIIYGESGNLTADGWQIQVFLKRDQRAIQRLFNPDAGITLVLFFFGLNMDVELPSREWQEDAGSNIENGRGFFGSLGQATVTWSLSADAVNKIGFVNQQR